MLTLSLAQHQERLPGGRAAARPVRRRRESPCHAVSPATAAPTDARTACSPTPTRTPSSTATPTRRSSSTASRCPATASRASTRRIRPCSPLLTRATLLCWLAQARYASCASDCVLLSLPPASQCHGMEIGIKRDPDARFRQCPSSGACRTAASRHGCGSNQQGSRAERPSGTSGGSCLLLRLRRRRRTPSRVNHSRSAQQQGRAGDVEPSKSNVGWPRVRLRDAVRADVITARRLAAHAARRGCGSVRRRVNQARIWRMSMCMAHGTCCLAHVGEILFLMRPPSRMGNEPGLATASEAEGAADVSSTCPHGAHGRFLSHAASTVVAACSRRSNARARGGAARARRVCARAVPHT